jgi:hypothetical protein
LCTKNYRLIISNKSSGVVNRQVGEKWVSDDCSYLCKGLYKRILEEINLYKPNIHYNYWVFIFIIFSKRNSNLMSEQTIDLKKRRFLTNATSVVGAVGVGFVAWPFLSTWNPSARAKAAGAPVEKPSLSPARTRFKEITHWAKIGFC